MTGVGGGQGSPSSAAVTALPGTPFSFFLPPGFFRLLNADCFQDRSAEVVEEFNRQFTGVAAKLQLFLTATALRSKEFP